MSKRPETPDVIGEQGGDVLSDVLGAGAGAQPATSKPAKQHDSKTAERRDSKPVKATYYLSRDVLNALDSAQLQLRQQAGAGRRGDVSKSAIVEAALRLALDDLERLVDVVLK
jgi:hypothetical protein